MIVGAHSIIYSKDADADRAFLRDVLGFPHVDVGHGWLIFGMPPAELGVHPGEENNHHEFYLMTDDVDAFTAQMTARGVACTPVQHMDWGSITLLTLPGGGQLGVYLAHHARPPAAAVPDAPWRAEDTAPPAKTRRPRAKAAAAKPRKKAAQARGQAAKPATKPAKKPAKKAAKKPAGKTPKKVARTSAKRAAPKARTKPGGRAKARRR